jgi:hypothetical protein
MTDDLKLATGSIPLSPLPSASLSPAGGRRFSAKHGGCFDANQEFLAPAAVVLVAVAGLFKLSTLQQLWRGDRPEFMVAMAALLGVLSSGLLRGVMIGAVISLVQLIRRVSRPHVAFRGCGSGYDGGGGWICDSEASTVSLPWRIAVDNLNH